MPITQTRRRFISSVALAGAAGLLHDPRVAAAEGAPETTAVRLVKVPGAICLAPENLSEELLRAEGFTDVGYVDGWPTGEYAVQVGKGEADFGLEFAAKIVQAIDDGGAVTVLGGVHVGCYELFAKDGIHSIAELKTLHVPDPRPFTDSLIAATALVDGLTVVTRNRADFEPMAVAVLNPCE